MANLVYLVIPSNSLRPLPDFEPDGDVDFVDFAWFAPYWWEIGCGTCGGADLTCDGDVDFNDLRKFTENWLW